MLSVLGPGYLEHPHRYCHPLGPVEDIPSDDEVEHRLRNNCHQDGYTPMGHPRQHYVRYARIMYYPQDSPVELGPTHVIPGTQYNRGLSDEDRANTLPVARTGRHGITDPFRRGACSGRVAAAAPPAHDQVYLYAGNRADGAHVELSEHRLGEGPPRLRLHTTSN